MHHWRRMSETDGASPARTRGGVERASEVRARTRFTTNPHEVLQERVLVAMVGLPARGKSYISKAVIRYLRFLGCPAKLFNAGNKRRTEGLAGTDASFFSASNTEAKAMREQMAMECLDELLDWLQAETEPEAGCACGIFDATNTTKARREKVRLRVARERPCVRLIWVETICDDVAVLEPPAVEPQSAARRPSARRAEQRGAPSASDARHGVVHMGARDVSVVCAPSGRADGGGSERQSSEPQRDREGWL